jgi:hypothetical protein
MVSVCNALPVRSFTVLTLFLLYSCGASKAYRVIVCNGTNVVTTPGICSTFRQSK